MSDHVNKIKTDEQVTPESDPCKADNAASEDTANPKGFASSCSDGWSGCCSGHFLSHES
jgi:hypothetical protein